jgi:hypothetical protein
VARAVDDSHAAGAKDIFQRILSEDLANENLWFRQLETASAGGTERSAPFDPPAISAKTEFHADTSWRPRASLNYSKNTSRAPID